MTFTLCSKPCPVFRAMISIVINIIISVVLPVALQISEQKQILIRVAAKVTQVKTGQKFPVIKQEAPTPTKNPKIWRDITDSYEDIRI